MRTLPRERWWFELLLFRQCSSERLIAAADYATGFTRKQ